MEQADEQPRDASPTLDRKPSFGHLLVVWFLVGSSFWTLGFALVDAVSVAVPLSRMGTGLLCGTIVVVLLWAVGWYPSLSASVGYFVAEAAVNLLLFFGIAPVFSSELTPWLEVGLHTTSITLAAALVFSNSGRRIRRWISHRTRALLKLPSEDHSPSQE
ncbi:hypothetical protein ACFR9U_20320 [Halorientalis brevis]|uniref:SPW repeat-containing protein n=1 Tax=Halorientalis brevis TaxID=1126241 RepID=A0ABD6CGZ4_9EURY|nr:hypothetical protein [Halorientalis brevis]